MALDVTGQNQEAQGPHHEVQSPLKAGGSLLELLGFHLGLPQQHEQRHHGLDSGCTHQGVNSLKHHNAVNPTVHHLCIIVRFGVRW